MKNILLASLLLTIVLYAVPTNAQKRSIDLEVIINTPDNYDTFDAAKPFPMKVSIQNNGPDNLIAGDSLFFMVIPGRVIELYRVKNTVQPGDIFTIIDIPIRFSNINQTTELDLCTVVLWDPSSQLTNRGEPISISYIDPDSTNNQPCKRLILKVNEPSSISDIKDNSLAIFPNPANDKINIPVNPLWHNDAHITITDIMGRRVRSQMVGKVENKYVTLDVKDLIPGLYTIEVYSAGYKDRAKIIIEH